MTNAEDLHPLRSSAAEVIGILKWPEASLVIPGGRRPGMTPSHVISGLVPVIHVLSRNVSVDLILRVAGDRLEGGFREHWSLLRDAAALLLR